MDVQLSDIQQELLLSQIELFDFADDDLPTPRRTG
jgi:hypothetical protein